MSTYIARSLVYVDIDGNEQTLPEVELGAASVPTVVLGDPGIGKTALMQMLGNRAGFHYISARSFLRRGLAPPEGEVLVIDALDEVAAVRDEDPVHDVLARLAELGCPRFVMSCRAADWHGALSRRDIAEDYGQAPLELRLTPLTREDAKAFLSEKLGEAEAEKVLASLESQSLDPLFGNPLMLQLIARLAKAGELPPTRAGMFERASILLGQEQDPGRSRTALSALSTEATIQAAGAAFAAMILSGAEAISRDPESVRTSGDLHLPDVATLPNASDLDTVLGSGLFRRVDGSNDRFAPIHRSIAEYLGARWLAGQASHSSNRRVLALTTLSGGVPASLRGLHAWLAKFSPELAPTVIAIDPYGVLRYGDADELTPDNARLLLQGLERLAQDDPWFRSGDWSRVSAKGLTQPTLLGEIRTKLVSATTNFHLRSILLDLVKASPEVAAALTPELKDILLRDDDRAYYFAERSAAADVLISLGVGNLDWTEVVETLHTRKGEDPRRLAVELMTDVGAGQFEPSLIIRAALSYLGLAEDDNEDKVDTLGPLYLLARAVPEGRAGEVMDELVAKGLSTKELPWEAQYALTDFVDTLVARSLRAGVPDPDRLLSWLRVVQSRESRQGGHRDEISQFLRTNVALRRRIQQRVLIHETDQENAWGRYWRLTQLEHALQVSVDDVEALLRDHVNFPDRTDPQVRETWKDVVRLGANSEGVPANVLDAANAFAQGDPDLQSFLQQLETPQRPRWQIEEEQRQARETTAREERWAKHRTEFGGSIDKIRAGDLSWIVPPGRAYFGRYNDMRNDLAPMERIEEWLGADVRTAVAEGFEALLTRTDLPSPQTVAESYAQSRRWHVIEPLLAALCQRAVQGHSFEDLTDDVLLTGRLGLSHEHVEDRYGGQELQTVLDETLKARSGLYERYARLLVEPQLEARFTHVRGLYQLCRPKVTEPTITNLAVEWLDRFPRMDLTAEDELVSYLFRASATEALRKAAADRRGHGYKDDEQRLAWLATEWLVDFDAHQAELERAAENKEFLWYLRGRSYPDQFDSEMIVTPRNPHQLAWVFRAFRAAWPLVQHPTGSSSGNQNPWDASDFLVGIVRRLASDTTDDAIDELAALLEVEDQYTPAIRNARAGQLKTRREARFTPISLTELAAVVTTTPPQTISDLQAVTLDALDRIQAKVRGDDLDSVSLFYDSTGPLDENRCRNRLGNLLQGELAHGIQAIPERHMPSGKRADLAILLGDLQLPIEAKGQWHRELWDAADVQLDGLYTKDWRAGGSGIYLVFWFGEGAPPSRRLQAPPKGTARPATALELKQALESRIPQHRQGPIAVYVLDVTR